MSPNQHQELLNELEQTGFKPTDVIYFCGLADPHNTLGIRAARGDLQQKLSTNFFVPTFIARALGGLGDPVNFGVVTCELAQVAMSPSTRYARP